MISPQEYYEGVGAHDNEHPWAFINCEELLDREVKDPGRQALLEGDGALRPRHRKPQHQRAECAEELRDGYRRLYRPLFHPERQRADHRAAARGDRRRHPVQSSRAEGRQERDRPLPAQHDERQGTGDARLRSRRDVPAAQLARDHGLGQRAAARLDGQACRLFRPSGALSARGAAVRRAVLGREDSGRLVDVGGVRRLLRLCRGRAARRRPPRRAQLPDRRLRCAGLRQSARRPADRCGDQVAAGRRSAMRARISWKARFIAGCRR